VSWGKIDPDRLPDAVVAYVDSTIALPILAAYALSKHEARPLKRLYKERERLLDALRAAHKDARSEVEPRGARS
jgi:deoxyhypusine synthase